MLPEIIYQKTAKRLQLSEEYVKDFVEYFYAYNKSRMFSVSYVVFYLSGLGRFIIRPIKFRAKRKKLNDLVEKFAERRDDRGIMIRNELEKRLFEYDQASPDVESLFEYNQKRMYKHLRDEYKVESNLEK